MERPSWMLRKPDSGLRVNSIRLARNGEPMAESDPTARAIRMLQSEALALRAILPWLIGHAAFSSGKEPPEALRELHAMAHNTLANWTIEGDADVALRVREAASIGIDNILSSIRITKLGPGDD